jgi:hypothetical protein
MPPLWHYSSQLLKKARRVHCCPQRAWTPDSATFPLQTDHFRGPPDGAMIVIVDP